MIEHVPKDRISAKQIRQEIESLLSYNPQQYQPRQQQYRGNVPIGMDTLHNYSRQFRSREG